MHASFHNTISYSLPITMVVVHKHICYLSIQKIVVILRYYLIFGCRVNYALLSDYTEQAPARGDPSAEVPTTSRYFYIVEVMI